MNDKVIYLSGKEEFFRPTREQKSLDVEIIEATHAVIDAVLKQAAIQLKRLDCEDSMIVLKELEASMLRVGRATQLAKLRS